MHALHYYYYSKLFLVSTNPNTWPVVIMFKCAVAYIKKGTIFLLGL